MSDALNAATQHAACQQILELRRGGQLILCIGNENCPANGMRTPLLLQQELFSLRNSHSFWMAFPILLQKISQRNLLTDRTEHFRLCSYKQFLPFCAAFLLTMETHHGNYLMAAQVNPLTVPQSYKLRFLPREVIGLDDVAAEIEAENPTYNRALVKAIISAFMRKMQQSLINGKQVTIEDFLTFTLSFTGRLDEADETPAYLSEMLQVKAYASQPFVKEVRHAAQYERLPLPTEKTPLLVSAEDTRLKLNDVLYAAGVLQLIGSNLFTEEAQQGWECVIEGTRSGRTIQTQFGPVSATGIVVVPNIPPQDAPWNNEYMVSVSTRYTEKGTLRTGTYRRRLRSPLTVAGLGHPHPQETGILTDHAAAAYVSMTGGAVSADEMLRIQAVLDVRENRLLVSLLDMKEGGVAGAAVAVAANGEYLLQGFAGSAVSNLAIKVNNFSALAEMVRNAYAGRVVDVLMVRTGN